MLLFIDGSHSENGVDELLRPMSGAHFYNFMISVKKYILMLYFIVCIHISTESEYVCNINLFSNLLT